MLTEQPPARSPYGSFPGVIGRDWLGRWCDLSRADLDLVDRRRTDATRLGFAVQLVTMRAIGTFLSAMGAKHTTIRPHCPWQNGKVERFNRTLQTEWAYRQPFTSNNERADALPHFLHNYNNHRRHHALAGHPPITRCHQPAS